MTSHSSPLPGPASRSTASLADLAASFQAPAPSVWPPATWIKIAVIAILFSLVNYWQYRVLVAKWWHDVDWSHGFLIPLFSLYLLYAHREELFAAPRRSFLPGLPLVVLGLICAVAGVHPVHNYFFSHVAMVLTLLGLVLYLAGPAVLRVTWLPVVYLVLAMPIPDTLYTQIALPLQMLAAKASGGLVKLFGGVVEVRGLQIYLVSASGVVYDPPLTVAEACSGIRSLMAFVALSVAYAFVEDRTWWQRLVLVLSGLPVTVACNILRVTLTCAMYVWDRPEFGQKLMHELMGIVLLIPALLLLMAEDRVLRSLVVEVEEEPPSPSEGSAAQPEGARL